MDDLREENELLHRAVQTLQQAVDQSADPATSAHCQAVLASATSPQKPRQRPPRLVLPAGGAGAAAEAAQLALSSGTSGGKPPLQSHFSVNADSSSRGMRQQGSGAGPPGVPGSSNANADGEDSDGDTISLMSLNDGDSFTTDSQSLGAGGSTPTAASLTVSLLVLLWGDRCRCTLQPIATASPTPAPPDAPPSCPHWRPHSTQAAREEGSTTVAMLNREVRAWLPHAALARSTCRMRCPAAFCH